MPIRKKGSSDTVKKKEIVFKTDKELNDMVGLYIEENLFQIVDTYQNEIMEYIMDTSHQETETGIKNYKKYPGQLSIEDCM